MFTMRFFFISLALLLFLSASAVSSGRSKRFTLSFGITHPGLYTEYSVEPETEILLNFKLKKTRLSTGIGVHLGSQIRREEINELIWVEDIGWLPHERVNFWNFKFTSITVPVYWSILTPNSFFKAFVTGLTIGQLLNYELKDEHSSLTPGFEINKLHMMVNAGLKKELFVWQAASLDLLPHFGYLIYLTSRNTWQKNYPYYGLKLHFNL